MMHIVETLTIGAPRLRWNFRAIVAGCAKALRGSSRYADRGPSSGMRRFLPLSQFVARGKNDQEFRARPYH